MRETMHYLQTALAGLSALGLAAGCASVDPKSPSTSAAGAGDVASKPFVFLAIQPDSHARLKNAAAKVTKESKLVRGSTFEQSEADQADYTFRLGFEVREGSLTAPEVIWGMTTIMLLTVYPATCNQHHYTLTADLEDRAGNRIKSYALYRSQRQFLWLFRGPNCEVPTERRVQRVAQSMLAEVYGDVAKSGVLKRPGAAVAGAPAGPLVYLSVSRAQDIVERATKATSPFARFTFDPAQASLADLSVHMDFSAHGGEPESFASLMGRG
ncbi:MAG TPA: hypothetical protein VD791_11620, partial [Burkholderiales bacterium]|nr:hypothetical protein [Burkholderiales bacterium]